MPTTPTHDLTVLQHEMVRQAVNIAKEHRLRNVAQLRTKLLERWPNKPEDINIALEFWADNA